MKNRLDAVGKKVHDVFNKIFPNEDFLFFNVDNDVTFEYRVQRYLVFFKVGIRFQHRNDVLFSKKSWRNDKNILKE